MSNKEAWLPPSGSQPSAPQSAEQQQQQQGNVGGSLSSQQHRPLPYLSTQQPVPGPVLPPPGMASGAPTGFYGVHQKVTLPGAVQPSHPSYSLPGMQSISGGSSHHPHPASGPTGIITSQTSSTQQTAQPAQSSHLPPPVTQAQSQGPPQRPPIVHGNMPAPSSGQPLGIPGGPPGVINQPSMPTQNGPTSTAGPHMLSALNGQTSNIGGPPPQPGTLQPSPVISSAQQTQQQSSQITQTGVNGPNGPILNVGGPVSNSIISVTFSHPIVVNPAAVVLSLPSVSPSNPPESPLTVTKRVAAASTTAAGVRSSVLRLNTHARSLNVKDALFYLDQVKLQFAEQPDVYNKFLDIMKDFKSQAIDTPGVIDRVSTLFCGHPDLIQGFNTFLPPGYTIECSRDPLDNSIRVTTPSGTTTATPSNGLGPILGREGTTHSNFYAQQGSRLVGGVEPMYQRYGPNGPSPVQQPEPLNARQIQQQRMFEERHAQDPHAAQQHYPQQAPQPGPIPHASSVAAGVDNLQNTAAATNGQPHALGGRPTPGGPSSAGGLENKAGGKGPVEFNHAISYVNKIKNRFASQPEIYKNFLEILQTYQRESKPIQDVYSQVTQLFHSAPDLLDDFKQFLPESAAQFRQAQAAATRAPAEEGNLAVPGIGGPGSGPGSIGSSRLPPVGNFAPPPSGVKEAKKKRGQPGQGPEQIPVRDIPPVGTPSTTTAVGRGVSNKRTKHHHTKASQDIPAVSPTLTPYQPEPVTAPVKNNASQEEIAFFDRVKKFIGNKQTYNEFLKLLNLFSQDLVDKNLLVAKVENFIGGNKELMEWFKRFIEYEPKDEVVNNVPKSNLQKVRLSVCRGLGPSYRMLPMLVRLPPLDKLAEAVIDARMRQESQRPCSGRDEMCWEVLNDQWASHPTWASEDSGFVAHRKNTYEEILHRIEEERHDYDFNIEANLRTIQLLEPIAQRIASMTPEERAKFKLQPGLGGQSKTIYKRVIKKVYDKDKGNEIIEALHSNPAVAVPVVLKRLKQKDEEWKLAQREWNKVWREASARVFWKSLDHQGISIKANDKKSFSQKFLVQEILTKHREQHNKRITPSAPIPEHQYKFSFNDYSIILDACRLLAISLENGSAFTANERDKVLDLIKSFIPLLFGMNPKDVEEKVNSISRRTPDEEAEEFPASLGDTPSTRTRRAPRKEDDNLLRDVLKRGKATRGRKEKEGSIASKESTPEVASVADEDIQMMDGAGAGAGSTTNPTNTQSDETFETWIKPPGAQRPGMLPGTPMEADEPSAPRKRTVYTLFGNNTIYTWIRTFHLLVSRLADIKACEEEVARDVQNRKGATVARELGILISTPETYFRDTSPAANYYKQVVEHCEQFIQGDLDAPSFEEGLRMVYIQKGWQLYTVDKLCTQILKYMQAFLSSDGKDKTAEIVLRFQDDRRRTQIVDAKKECMRLIDYRMKVEELIPAEDPIYRIEWNEDVKDMTIQYLVKGDPTINDAVTREQKWNYYIQSYTMSAPTEGVMLKCTPFLKRNVNPMWAYYDSAEPGDEAEGNNANPSSEGTRTPPATKPSSGALPKSSSGAPIAGYTSIDNLEVKICVNTYKIFFTHGTEDFLLAGPRRRYGPRVQQMARRATEKRRRIWRKFLEEGTNWMVGGPIPKEKRNREKDGGDVESEDKGERKPLSKEEIEGYKKRWEEAVRTGFKQDQWVFGGVNMPDGSVEEEDVLMEG